MNKLLALAVAATLAGCAARSTVQLADSRAPAPQAHAEQVCMLKSALPANVKYTVVGSINSSKQTYGSVNELLPLMAADARKVGADAIVNLNTAQRIGAWAWARPVGTGTAVKLADRKGFDCAGLGGELR